jgi:polyhydroxyalkanoate synthesis regulator phasin
MVGITEMPRDRAERLVRDLQRRGEVRAKDIQTAVQQVVERSTRNRQELIRLVQKEISRQIHALGLATRDDVDRLARRVKALESQRKTPSRAAAKKPATRRRASIPAEPS